jgi:hypothetical protein
MLRWKLLQWGLRRRLRLLLIGSAGTRMAPPSRSPLLLPMRG